MTTVVADGATLDPHTSHHVITAEVARERGIEVPQALTSGTWLLVQDDAILAWGPTKEDVSSIARHYLA